MSPISAIKFCRAVDVNARKARESPRGNPLTLGPKTKSRHDQHRP
jgi:hypothetical protein